MFCRWRATVCSLTTSSAAIARLVSPRHEPEHLQLAGGQAVAGAGLVPATRPRARERAARRVQLHRGRLVVAEGSARRTDQRPHPRGLVRRVDPLPQRRGAAQGHQRGAGSPAARSTAPRVCAAIAPSMSLPCSSAIRSSSVAAPRAPPRFADGEHDLDVRGQQPSALRPLVARPARAGSRPPRRRRRPAPAAAAPVPAEARGRPARLAVGLLGRRALPAAGEPRPAGTRPRRPPTRFCPARSAGRPAAPHRARRATRRGGSRISARWVRQRPVKATMSGCCRTTA